jgi:hypothetical protein
MFSYTGQAIVVDQSVTLTTSWQRFTYTTTALTSYNEYGLFFFSVPTGTAGAADYFDVTGVQLEANYQPTPFEQRPIGVELQLCQRYYYRIDGTSGVFTSVATGGVCTSTVVGRVTTFLPVPMRATTTSTASIAYSGLIAYDGSVTPAVTSLTGTWSTPTTVSMDFGSSAGTLTANRPGQIFTSNTGSGNYWAINMEL